MRVKPTYEIKWSTVAVPTEPEYKGMEVFATTMEGLSGGEIKVRPFHSGQLGDHENPDRRTPLRANSYHYFSLSDGSVLVSLVLRKASTTISRKGDWP